MSPLFLTVKEEKILTVSVDPVEAYQAATWASDAPDVATVDGDGRVTAVGPGIAVITVTDADGS